MQFISNNDFCNNLLLISSIFQVSLKSRKIGNKNHTKMTFMPTKPRKLQAKSAKSVFIHEQNVKNVANKVSFVFDIYKFITIMLKKVYEFK